MQTRLDMSAFFKPTVKKTMTKTPSLMAKDHGLTLGTASDALDVIGSGLPGCIFTQADLAPDFFDLRNGLAGEIFQKFVNYQFPVAFILSNDHGLGNRVTELIRDHRRHSTIRFFGTAEEAMAWLQ